MAERREQLAVSVTAPAAIGSSSPAIGIAGGHADAQPPGLACRGARERLRPVAGPTWRRPARSPPGRPASRRSPRSCAEHAVLHQTSSPCSGPRETRPRVGLSPTSPQQAAGMRIEPPPSLPCAIGTMPAATAAAAPPEEPPGGARGVPGVAGRAEAARLADRDDPELGHVGLAHDHEARLADAAHHVRVVSGTKSPNRSEPIVKSIPATGVVSLMAIGTPANGRGSPGPMASAAASAPSASTWTNAFSSGWSASMRSKRGLHELAGAELAVADELRELGHGREHQVATRGEPYAGTSSARKAPSALRWRPRTRRAGRAPRRPATRSRHRGPARSPRSTRRAPPTRRSGPSAG